jgi:hypothetical protein
MKLKNVHFEKFIAISECQYLAKGTRKTVYASCSLPGMVLKVVSPDAVNANGQFKRQGRHKQLRSTGVYREFAREITQFLALCRRSHGRGNSCFPIAVPVGLVQTECGLALASERIVDCNGELAPTLSAILARGEFNQLHADALVQFFRQCDCHHIVLAEVNLDGLLYTTQRSGVPEIVLVDGIGERNLIPLKSWFRALNSRRIRKVESNIWAQIFATVQGDQAILRDYRHRLRLLRV